MRCKHKWVDPDKIVPYFKFTKTNTSTSEKTVVLKPIHWSKYENLHLNTKAARLSNKRNKGTGDGSSVSN